MVPTKDDISSEVLRVTVLGLIGRVLGLWRGKYRRIAVGIDGEVL